MTSYLEAGAALVRRKQENHWRRGHSHLVVELRQSKESRRRVQQGWEGGGGGEGTVVLSGIRHLGELQPKTPPWVTRRCLRRSRSVSQL